MNETPFRCSQGNFDKIHKIWQTLWIVSDNVTLLHKVLFLCTGDHNGENNDNNNDDLLPILDCG